MSSEAPDSTLKNVKAGDRAALEELLRRHDSRLRQIAKGLLGNRLRNRVRTSDLLQSTYLEVLTSIQGFRGDSEEAFTHWVVRILENNVRDAARYHRAGKRAQDRESSLTDLAQLVIPAHPTPSSQAVASEELFLVGRALQRLRADYRRVILIMLSPSGSHKEAARRLGRSEGATRVLLARARAALLIELDKLRKRSDVQ